MMSSTPKITMWRDDHILDAVAGKIDAPCQWRLQFWICVAFNRWSVAMLEGERSRAAAYLWILSPEQSNAICGQNSTSGLGTAPFDLEDVRELSLSQTNYWQHWPFFRVGDIPEPVESQTRDGIWMTLRSFDGAVTHRADLSNPDDKLQPLRLQAQREVFALLSQIWDWQKAMDDSNLVKRRNK